MQYTRQLRAGTTGILAAALLMAAAPWDVLAQPAPGASASDAAPAPTAPPPGPPGRSKDVHGPTARAPDKVWALSGVWSVIESGRPQTPVPAKGFIAFKPDYEIKRAELEREDRSGEIIKGRNSRCIPAGLPDMMTFGFNVFATADYLVVLGGYGTERPVWLKRTHHTPARVLFPTYQGESLGHWEGDTLVIDTIGLDPSNEITYGLPANDPNLHVIEHWQMPDQNTLRVEISVISPAALERPWNYVMVYARRPDAELVGEGTYCDQPLINNKMDLTPPPGGYIPPGADQ